MPLVSISDDQRGPVPLGVNWLATVYHGLPGDVSQPRPVRFRRGSSPHGRIGDLLSGGLRDLVDTFKQKGQGEVADSWVSRGPNKQIAPPQLEQAIGPDVLETLSQQTGLSREELLSRLSKNLPEAVDKYTPEGRIPGAGDFARS